MNPVVSLPPSPLFCFSSSVCCAKAGDIVASACRLPQVSCSEQTTPLSVFLEKGKVRREGEVAQLCLACPFLLQGISLTQGSNPGLLLTGVCFVHCCIPRF